MKFYESERGFGFVISDETSSDLFLQQRKLDKLQIPAVDVEVGDRVVCEYSETEKGLAVSRIIEYTPFAERDDISAGTVDVYNNERGFGFIKVDGGNDRVFFHVSVLAPYGMDSVQPGQRVRFVLGLNQDRVCVSALHLLDEVVAPPAKTQMKRGQHKKTQLSYSA